MASEIEATLPWEALPENNSLRSPLNQNETIKTVPPPSEKERDGTKRIKITKSRPIEPTRQKRHF